MSVDAVVVGSGPNGLAAAITLAAKGLKVTLFEGSPTPGGGMRTLELTEPGFRHDVCSAIHPTALASPFFQSLRLDVDWIFPAYPAGHAFLPERAVIMERCIDGTAARLGRDGPAYVRMLESLVEGWPFLDLELLGPLSVPRSPLLMADFGLKALWPARALLNLWFREPQAKALLAGICAHTVMPLDWPPSMAPGLVLAAAGHRFGWPMARGGSQAIADALVARFRQLGGELVCGVWVKDLAELPPSRLVLLDVTPRQFLSLAGDRLPSGYRRALEGFRHGQGVFKIDYALHDPIPWKDPELKRAGTVHLAGTLDDLAEAEAAVWQNRNPERPYVLLAQQSIFDPSRAPAGKHTAWAYCHTPACSSFDFTSRIEEQIERYAPGFRDCVIARHTYNCTELEAYNPNYVGGDIGGGALLLQQLFTRPVLRLNPYSTPLEGVYLCSSSTPPGGGVHGMCGYHAALSAFRRAFLE